MVDILVQPLVCACALCLMIVCFIYKLSLTPLITALGLQVTSSRKFKPQSSSMKFDLWHTAELRFHPGGHWHTAELRFHPGGLFHKRTTRLTASSLNIISLCPSSSSSRKRIGCSSMLNEFFLYVLNLYTRDIGGGDRAAAPRHPAPSVLDNESSDAVPRRQNSSLRRGAPQCRHRRKNRCMI
jgi:hypothetical protein